MQKASLIGGSIDRASLVQEADRLLTELYPICRSLTGDGVRKTLDILRKVVDFDVHEIPSGKKCFDWTIPDEWNIRDAFVADACGNRLIDFRAHNIHVVSYSDPIDTTVSFSELRDHLHTLPEMPDVIPYRTSYYSRDWGFCLAHNDLSRFEENQTYRVVIDATLAPGSLTLGDRILPGTRDLEYLVTTYSCHPSLANDNLSGVVLWTLLLRELSSKTMLNSYRFAIHPETIGALAYLAQNDSLASEVNGGFVITTVAGPGPLGYKSSYRGDHIIDRAASMMFEEARVDFVPYPFDHGSDERQYSSPGFRIPMGTICKDKYFAYDAYHTSLDDLSFVSAENLVQTLECYLETIAILEMAVTYRSLCPNGEAELGRRGLWPVVGGQIKQKGTGTETDEGILEYRINDSESKSGDRLDALLWLMFYGDGSTSLLDIAEKTGLPIKILHDAAKSLVSHDLLEPV